MPISSRNKADRPTPDSDNRLHPEAAPVSPILCGRIVGVFGVRGALKILSQTDPPEKLLSYHPWWLGQPGSETPVIPESGRLLRRGLLAVLLPGVRDREVAREYVGFDVSVERKRFPEPGSGQFYWADLVGLAVEDMEGRFCGRVREVVRGPAGDILDVRGGRSLLIPFLWQKTIIAVDPEAGCIRVCWPESF